MITCKNVVSKWYWTISCCESTWTKTVPYTDTRLKEFTIMTVFPPNRVLRNSEDKIYINLRIDPWVIDLCHNDIAIRKRVHVCVYLTLHLSIKSGMHMLHILIDFIYLSNLVSWLIKCFTERSLIRLQWSDPEQLGQRI